MPARNTTGRPTGQVQVTVYKTVDVDTHAAISEASFSCGELEAKQMQFAV